MIARIAGFLGCAALAAAGAPTECAPCHREARGFGEAAMARAMVPAAQSTILKANPKLAAKLGGYSYEIADATLTVTDGKETMRVPLDWAFGDGKVGQTYLYRRNGVWYESRVSYFPGIAGLDITIGQQNLIPHDLLTASGRLVASAEASRCFDCHATAARTPRMTAGVQCERCHGGVDQHLRSGAAMKKLSALTTEELSDSCGECHRTWSQIAANGPRGIENIRFQPYRLAGSKCYDAADNRIKCTACHDPHGRLEAAADAYDAECRACHSKAANGKLCRTAARGCVGCHMPKIELPGAHRKFTDHRIRVVREGDAYPD
jgi:hypothetical protein